MSVKVINYHFNYSSGGGRCPLFTRCQVTIARSTDAARQLRTILLIATLMFIWTCSSLDFVIYHDTMHADAYHHCLDMSWVAMLPYKLFASTRTASGSYKPLRTSSRWSILLLLCTTGDVEINPGPKAPKFPCAICYKAVKQCDPAICCDNCESMHGFTTHAVVCQPTCTQLWRIAAVHGFVQSVDCHHSRHRSSVQIVTHQHPTPLVFSCVIKTLTVILYTAVLLVKSFHRQSRTEHYWKLFQ